MLPSRAALTAQNSRRTKSEAPLIKIMKSQITDSRTQRMLFKDVFCSVDCANIVNRMQTARFLATSHPYCYLVLSWWNFSDGLMLEFLCRFGSATWNEGEQGRPLVRQTENVFLRFFRFRSSRSWDFQTHKSNLMCKLRLGACKGLGRWNVGGGRLQVMSQIFYGT